MIEQEHNHHKGFHKEQVLLGSPDVLVEVEVKDKYIPPVVSNSLNDGAQEDEVLQKVMQLDLG
jgi:hypothetical protein